jgi:hypothetical protein
MPTFLAILCGGALFLWPALLNGYPLLFSDTGGLLAMAIEPSMGWDKPWVYGPFLFLLHGRTTLWLAAVGQVLLLSQVLWLAASAARHWPPARHVALCAALSLLSAAPWVASTLMPDVFAPITVLCVFALAWPERLSRPARGWLVAVGILAVASHLAHLILASACIATAVLVRRRALTPRSTLRLAAPVWAALLVLLLTNLLGNGVLGVSPYGSVFMLARLVADGPAREVVDARCPAAGWHLCAWKGRLPTDSDAFLWAPDSPVWDDGRYGPVEFAPEAARIVRETVRAHPGEVAAAMAMNTARQLPRTDLGDTLGPNYLDLTVLPRLQAFFPAAEVARYRASLQVQGQLRATAKPLLWPLRIALLLGLGATAWVLAQWRRDPSGAGLALLVLVGFVANAFSTGALSHVHDRYQARIAWLLLVPPLVTLPRAQPLRAAAARASRSREAAAQ